MPRAIWKGSISFGLVNVPVAMYAAIAEHDLHFHLVHVEDGSPIGYEKVCKKEQTAVPDSQIGRAYELDDGSLVLLEDSDFEAAKADGYHAITVLDFVDHQEIDPIFFERASYLGPDGEGAVPVYTLLAEAMKASGLAAICSYIFHKREQLGCLRVHDGVLVLEKMYFADEIRDPDDVRPARRPRVKAEELKMARQLIDAMTGAFTPDRYEDSYRAALLKVIERKAKGETIAAPEPEEQPEARDLMAALQASLTASTRHATRPKRTTTRSRPKRKAA